MNNNTIYCVSIFKCDNEYRHFKNALAAPPKGSVALTSLLSVSPSLQSPIPLLSVSCKPVYILALVNTHLSTPTVCQSIWNVGMLVSTVKRIIFFASDYIRNLLFSTSALQNATSWKWQFYVLVCNSSKYYGNHKQTEEEGAILAE